MPPNNDIDFIIVYFLNKRYQLCGSNCKFPVAFRKNALKNDNTAVSVTCGGQELVQNGNDKFVLNLDVDKTTQEGVIQKRFESSATLHISIFDRDIGLTISGTKGYNFIENNIEKTEITLPPAYDGCVYRTVRIPC